MRISYEAGGLLEGDLAAGPLEQFDAWFKAAVESKVGCASTLRLARCPHI
jgi:pyridoxine/pyridoxamine 5'-phosphate oxidase